MKSKLITLILYVVSCVCLLAVMLLVGISDPYERAVPTGSPLSTAATGWSIVEGDQRVPVQLDTQVATEGNTLTIERLYNPRKTDDILFFYNVRQGVTVTANGTVVYQLGSEGSDKKLNSSNYCVAQLPNLESPYMVQVTFTNLQNNICHLPNISFCTINDVIAFFGEQDLFTLMSFPVWITMFLVLIALVILLHKWKIREHRILCMAIFMFCAAGWSFTDMYFVALFPVNPEICSTLSYYFLMFIPVPIAFFVKWSCANCNLRLWRPFVWLLLANIICQSVLYFLNIAVMNQFLIISQAFMVLSVVYAFACMVKDYRVAPSKAGKAQMIAFAVVFLAGMATVAAYWLVDGAFYRNLFQAIIIFFVIMMTFVVSYSGSQRNYEQKMKVIELETYKKLSNVDGLTGIQNRRSFDEDIQKVWESAERYPNAQLVFLDLNGLKYANDRFGHLAGDELIIAAGRLISSAFGEVGRCYRIGGDEFAAVIEGSVEGVYNGYDKLDEEIEQYNENRELQLSIARGFCSLYDVLGHKRSISDWKTEADKNMYRDKLQLGYTFVRGSNEDYQEIISSFASAVDAKDSYTADHSERVGIMADRICTMLGLSETSTSQIHTAARLHDIGKIGMADSILSKEGELSEEEWEVMRSHSIVGESIVKHTKAFYEVSQIIRSHHERFDGKGYPDGLCGSDIPIGARVVAIADSIDAMTSNRSYRGAHTLEFCREEVQKNLGVMFDPAIGQIVLENWQEIEEVVLAHPKELRNPEFQKPRQTS